jgi:hypothetical protein
MIWFGDLARLTPHVPQALLRAPEHTRMQRALESVAAREPQLSGRPLVEALAATGWVDEATAARLLPAYLRHFDADRYFAERLRRLSFRGPLVADDFREGVARSIADVIGDAELGSIGPEPAIRFRCGEREGYVLAYPEVGFSLGGAVRDAIAAAAEHVPDALVIVARNFQSQTAAQLASLLERTEVPGTLVTVNLLLGMRAVALRYQPAPERVVRLLGAGRPLRTQDVARLGDRVAA